MYIYIFHILRTVEKCVVIPHCLCRDSLTLKGLKYYHGKSIRFPTK